MLPSILLILFGAYITMLTRTTDKSDLLQILPLTAVDEYKPCLRFPGDSYCFASARISGEASNPIYKTLVEHSADNLTHYDRTNIHRGICVKTTCKNCLGLSTNRTIVLEACLNASLNQDHGLTAKVYKVFCEEYRETVKYDGSDYAFGVVVLALLLLNVLGTLYDYIGGRGDSFVGKLLLCFAVRRNWQRLMSPGSADPRQSRLASFNAYRVILATGSIMAHACVVSTHAAENPEFFEESYNSVYLVLHRTLETLQITCIVSGILLVYKLLSSEDQVSWRNLHMALLWRWLRFTPTYALLLFFIATWTRYIGSGPFWNSTMGVEINDCRRHWWLHLLYIHNYVDNSRCMIHSWSLAVDMQLTVLGLIIFFLLKSNKARRAAISLVLLLGVVYIAAPTYYKNLYPIVVSTPEAVLNWFAHDPTFNNLYKRGHTNILGYALGWAMGYVVYNLKDSDIGAEKYKKYSVLLQLLYPLTVAFNTTGVVFFDYTAAVSLPARVVYAVANKLVTGLLLSLHIFLTIVQANDLRTKIYNWQGWTPLARLSFNVYLVHMCLLRIRAGSVHTLFHNSEYAVILSFVETTVVSLLLAVVLFVAVEAPCAQLTRMSLAPAQKKHSD